VNLNLRCPEILQMTKMTSFMNKNYEDSTHRVQQTDRLSNYDCRKTKFDSGSSLLWGINEGDNF